MALFVRTLSEQAERRECCLWFFIYLLIRLDRGQIGMITGHLCLRSPVSSAPRTSDPVPSSPPTSVGVCVWICAQLSSYRQLVSLGIKEWSVR